MPSIVFLCLYELGTLVDAFAFEGWFKEISIRPGSLGVLSII